MWPAQRIHHILGCGLRALRVHESESAPIIILLSPVARVPLTPPSHLLGQPHAVYNLWMPEDPDPEQERDHNEQERRDHKPRCKEGAASTRAGGRQAAPPVSLSGSVVECAGARRSKRKRLAFSPPHHFDEQDSSGCSSLRTSLLLTRAAPVASEIAVSTSASSKCLP